MFTNKVILYTDSPIDVVVTPNTQVAVIVHSTKDNPTAVVKPLPGHWLQKANGILDPIKGQGKYFYVVNSGSQIRRTIKQIVKFSFHLAVIYCIGLFFWIKRRYNQ
jgi:hypothetical protein